MRRSALLVAMPLALVAGLASGPLHAAEAAPSDIAWGPCTGVEFLRSPGAECGRLVVPVDRADPGGPTFSLAVARHRSTGTPRQRIGSLVFNPGGPGGSGLAALEGTWARLPASIRDRFDLVTWDPRGVGLTTPALVPCPSPAGGRPLPLTGPVDWSAIVAEAADVMAPAEAACQAANASLVGHLGTRAAVDDLDALRAALGDQRLTFWGQSYGTAIGSAYAALHPDRVRAVLLDSPIDPGPLTARQLGQDAAAPGQAYGVFARFFPAADRTLQHVLARVARHPVRLSDAVTLSRWTVLPWIEGMTADQTEYASAADAIGRLDEAVLGTGPARRQARTWVEYHLRTQWDAYAGMTGWWLPAAVSCLDSTQRPAAAEVSAAASRVAARWSDSAALDVATSAAACAGFTMAADPVPVLTAGSGPRLPLLVVGSRRDGRTSGAWIPLMTAAFPGARSVTYGGGQHVVFGSTGSTCLDSPVARYLLTGHLPATDVSCPVTYEVGGLVG
jgi:pimeloyl-ACP methyl ester carboxylesterase